MMNLLICILCMGFGVVVHWWINGNIGDDFLIEECLPGRHIFNDVQHNLCIHGNFRRFHGQGRPPKNYELKNVLDHFESNLQINIRTVFSITNIHR